MSKTNTPGKIVSLLHLGHSVSNRGNAMKFYNEDMEARACRIQRSDAPYIGQVNGATGCVADIAFLEYGYDEPRPMVELLDFINPVDITREYKPGEPAYSHVGFRTKDVRACYDRMIKKGLTPLTPPQRVDYGYAKGRGAFLLLDPDNTYVQITQDEVYEAGNGAVIDQDHLVMSVPKLDDVIPAFRDLMACDVTTEEVSGSRYLSGISAKPVSKIAICRSKLEKYTVELWETGDAGGVEDLYITGPGSIHLCFLCEGIDNVYETFKAAGMRFVNEPVNITKGANKGAKAIFFRTPGYLWVELLCRADKL